MESEVRNSLVLAIDDYISEIDIDVRDESRFKNVVAARQAFMSAAYTFLDGALHRLIGDAFNKDYSTVIYACNVVRTAENNKDATSRMIMRYYHIAIPILRGYNSDNIEKIRDKAIDSVKLTSANRKIKYQKRIIDHLTNKTDRKQSEIDALKEELRLSKEFNARLYKEDPELYRINKLREEYIG